VAILKVILLSILLWFLSPKSAPAQGFGDYGRALGGVGQGQGGTVPRAPGTSSPSNKGKGVSGGVGDVGGRDMPSRLVVASKEAALYPRQDDEAEKIDRLVEGETLVPMVQSEGGRDWYMVKTSKGLIGWVKSVDVRTKKGTQP